jgi:hypothetical protein
MVALFKGIIWRTFRTGLSVLGGVWFCLLNNTTVAQASPSGSFKIESVEGAQKPDSDEVDVSEFVVSTNDPELKELLSEHPSTTNVSFSVSPDEKWIFEHISYGSRMCGGDLFKRGEGLKFKSVTENFDEAAWRFFAKEEKIPE